MRIKIKELKPNPFRDFEHYQPVREVVEHLKGSINETFFWENLIGRQVNGQIEIAYGHHRLIALRELFPDRNKTINIPIYDLTDEQMLRIMATENETGKNLTITHIDLTVKKAKEFLEAHPEIAKKYGVAKKEIGVDILSNFLGWNKTRVKHSLDRFRSIGRNLEKSAVEEMPTEQAARDFVGAVKKTGASKETQKKVAKKIVESRAPDKKETEGIYGQEAIEDEMLMEEHGFNEQKKKEKKFEDYIDETRKKAASLISNLETILEFKEDFDSGYYDKSLEKLRLLETLDRLIFWAKKIFDRRQVEKEKEKKSIPQNL